jgi:xylulose-5-phosphate/fructose-6-phosphate phosphoketolase
VKQNSTYRFDETISSMVEDGATPPVAEESVEGPLSDDLLDKMHRYWQAANYLTLGQIYLQENPLMRESLRPEHIKPRLLGHWGTSPGLSLIYVHLNRIIREHDADVIYLAGPGHGGPAVLANVYLEGTYSEVYPDVSQDVAGVRRLFRQFSTPGGVPSHVSVPTPGSIHEGGELGYVLTHAFGAAFDNPDLLVAAVVGDGEAETGPLEGSWKSISFLNPARDGAVLPILHLNGYKISGPTVLGRAPDEEIRKLLEGYGYEVHFVEGDDPASVHQAFAATLDLCYEQIRAVQRQAREGDLDVSGRPRWPAIVLRTPKGWTGPHEVDGLPVEGTFRSHQVPLSNVRSDPEQLALLEEWMRSYHPEELFDQEGRLIPELAALIPRSDCRMGASPHANGGRVLKDLELPDFRDYAVEVPTPAREHRESTRRLGEMLRDTFTLNSAAANFRLFCPDETNSNRLGAVLSEHLCEGWLEGYLLTGRHGLFATYEAFAMIPASMIVQHTKWLEEAVNLPWREPISSLNILLTSTAWRNDHNGFSHQGPGLIDVMLSKRGTVARIYLPPDANTLLACAEHCLRSRNYVNLIAIDKQPQLQWLDMDAANEHLALGASIWEWASNVPEGEEPDIVLGCAGDIPTLETVAAAHWLRENAPELKVRVVNVVDLMTLFPREFHPHGMDETRFVELFTADKQVVFAFHGYRRAIHEIVHGHVDVDRFHVRGFSEQGTTTTPFDMVVLNGMSRYHLAMEALERLGPECRAQDRAPTLISELEALISRATAYSREHLQDPPEIREWVWTQ